VSCEKPQEVLCSVMTHFSFMKHRIQPLMKRHHYGYEYTGSDDDSRFTNEEINSDAVMERLDKSFKNMPSGVSAATVPEYSAERPPKRTLSVSTPCRHCPNMVKAGLIWSRGPQSRDKYPTRKLRTKLKKASSKTCRQMMMIRPLSSASRRSRVMGTLLLLLLLSPDRRRGRRELFADDISPPSKQKRTVMKRCIRKVLAP